MTAPRSPQRYRYRAAQVGLLLALCTSGVLVWYRNREFRAHDTRMIELDGLASEARQQRDQADLLLKRSHEILQAASAHGASEDKATPAPPVEDEAAQPAGEPSPSKDH